MVRMRSGERAKGWRLLGSQRKETSCPVCRGGLWYVEGSGHVEKVQPEYAAKDAGYRQNIHGSVLSKAILFACICSVGYGRWGRVGLEGWKTWSDLCFGKITL